MSTETTYKQGRTISTAYTGTKGDIIVPAGVSKIRVLASTDAFVAIGAGAVATTASMPVTGKVYEYFDCSPGDIVSFIQSSSNGTGYVTLMSK